VRRRISVVPSVVARSDPHLNNTTLAHNDKSGVGQCTGLAQLGLLKSLMRRNPITLWALLVQSFLSRDYTRAIDVRDRLIDYLFSSFHARVGRRRRARVLREFKRGASLPPNDLAFAISLTAPSDSRGNQPKPDSDRIDDYDPIVSTQAPRASAERHSGAAVQGFLSGSEVVDFDDALDSWLRNRYWK